MHRDLRVFERAVGVGLPKMQQWWLALVPVAAAAIGYLAKRHFGLSSRAEAIKRRLQAAALVREMRRERATMDDLDQIERDAS